VREIKRKEKKRKKIREKIKIGRKGKK